MTDRLAEVSARIDGVRQLGTVVNAMKGIAAARARVALSQVDAVDSYTDLIADAVASIVQRDEIAHPRHASPASASQTGLLIFCAEQGFAGAFSEHVLDSLAEAALGKDGLDEAQIFLIGTRGLTIAQARGLTPAWSAAMPSHTPGIPKLATEIVTEIYKRIDSGRLQTLHVVHSTSGSGRIRVERKPLIPLDFGTRPSASSGPPLIQIPVEDLTLRLGADYLHALICRSALHAFASENAARMEAMASAGSQIARELDHFEATLRRVRQEAITAEIIELGTGSVSPRR